MLVMTQDRAISIKEAARRLSVSERTIRRMIDTGEIRAFRVIGQWRIRESEIERVMSGGQEEDHEDE